MSEIIYPAQVVSYKVFFTEDSTENTPLIVNLAYIDFVPIQEIGSLGFKAFTNRGGFMQATRPLWLLSSILVLLEQGDAIQIDGNANLTKTKKTDKVLN